MQSRKDDRDQKIGLDLKSNAFTPKLKGTASSTKSIDEFDTSNNNSTSTQKESGAKKLKASSTTFKPGMKSTSNSFKPVNSRPIPSISQSQTAPYSYQPVIFLYLSCFIWQNKCLCSSSNFLYYFAYW